MSPVIKVKGESSSDHSPLSEAVQVVVETGSVFAALFSPQDTGGVDDTAVQHRAGHERYTHRFMITNISCEQLTT